MPPPFTVELPVVARSGPEPPAEPARGRAHGRRAYDVGRLSAVRTRQSDTRQPDTRQPDTRQPDTLAARHPAARHPAARHRAGSTAAGPTPGDPTGGGGLPTTVPAGGPLVTATSSPPPGPAAPTSGPDPASADVGASHRGQPSRGVRLGAGRADRAAERVRGPDREPDEPDRGRRTDASVGSIGLTAGAAPGGSGPSTCRPGRPQPSEGQAATPPAASAGSAEPLVAPTEPLVVPTVGGEPPRCSGLPTTRAVRRAARASSQPPAEDLLITPTGGSASTPGAALPVVARLTASNPPPATSLPGRPSPGTETAALVSHRPPLAVRSDLSSAVPPPPTVQRVSFSGPGEPSTGHRPVAPAPAIQQSHPTGAPVGSRAVESPVSPLGFRGPRWPGGRWYPTVAAPGRIERRSWSRFGCSAGRPACRAALRRVPAATPAAGPASTFASRAVVDRRPGRARSPPCSPPGRASRPRRRLRVIPATPPSSCRPRPNPPPAARRRTSRPPHRPPSHRRRRPARRPPRPPAGAAPTAGAAAAQLDEMARRLFEPLSARLRAELWLDRERAGLVTDARH